MKDSFDVIVIARGIGGFICALTLACRKARVLLVVPQEARTPPVLLGAGKMGLFRAICNDLGVWEDIRGDISFPPVAYQAAFPGRRIDIHADPSEFLREIDREYPGKRAELSAVLARLKDTDEKLRSRLLRLFFREHGRPFLSSLAYRKLRKDRLSALLAPYPGAGQYSPLFTAQTLGFSGVSDTDTFVLGAAFHIASLDGVFSAEKGIFTVLRGLLEHHSCTVLDNAPVREVTARGKTVTGCLIGNDTLSTKALATDMTTEDLLAVLPALLKKKVLKRFPQTDHVPWRYHYDFLAPEDAIPEGMGDAVVFVPDAPMTISLRHGAPPGQNGKVAMSVSCESPGETPVEELLPTLHDLMPFLKSDGNEVVPRQPFLSREPLLSTRGLHTFPIRACAPKMPGKGLYRCGSTLFPTLGLEGEMLAGFLCAQEILKKIL